MRKHSAVYESVHFLIPNQYETNFTVQPGRSHGENAEVANPGCIDF